MNDFEKRATARLAEYEKAQTLLNDDQALLKVALEIVKAAPQPLDPTEKNTLNRALDAYCVALNTSSNAGWVTTVKGKLGL